LPTPNAELDLKSLVSALWRRRLIVAVAATVTTLIALALSIRSDPVYSAAADVLVQPRVQTDGISSPDRDPVLTEIRIMESAPVLTAATRTLGYAPTIEIAQPDESEVVQVIAHERTAQRAADSANVYARAYVDVRRTTVTKELAERITAVQKSYRTTQDAIDTLLAPLDVIDSRIARTSDATARERLQVEREGIVERITGQRQTLEGQLAGYTQQLGQLQNASTAIQTSGAEVISAADKPGAPTSPKPKRDAALALFVGLVLGAGIALLVDRLDDTIRVDQIEEITGLPILGTIPRSERLAEGLVHVGNRSSVPAEAVRMIRTALEFTGLEGQLKTVLVTSANPSEGKTTLVANLAVATALTGRRAIAVSGDLRRPALHLAFGLSNEVGFTSVLLGTATARQAVLPVAGVPNLRVVPSGPPPPNPTEVLASPVARALLSGLVHGADLVLVDGPPLLPVADSLVLCRSVDGVLLVVDTTGGTSRRDLRRALELLNQVEARVLGVVVNGVATSDVSYYGDPIPAPTEVAAAPVDPRPAHGAGSHEPGEDPQGLRQPGVDQVWPQDVHRDQDEDEGAESEREAPVDLRFARGALASEAPGARDHPPGSHKQRQPSSEPDREIAGLGVGPGNLGLSGAEAGDPVAPDEGEVLVTPDIGAEGDGLGDGGTAGPASELLVDAVAEGAAEEDDRDDTERHEPPHDANRAVAPDDGGRAYDRGEQRREGLREDKGDRGEAEHALDRERREDLSVPPGEYRDTDQDHDDEVAGKGVPALEDTGRAGVVHVAPGVEQPAAGEGLHEGARTPDVLLLEGGEDRHRDAAEQEVAHGAGPELGRDHRRGNGSVEDEELEGRDDETDGRRVEAAAGPGHVDDAEQDVQPHEDGEGDVELAPRGWLMTTRRYDDEQGDTEDQSLRQSHAGDQEPLFGASGDRDQGGQHEPGSGWIADDGDTERYSEHPADDQ
jgi:capsular exopolysaccharide synthesis family protein